MTDPYAPATRIIDIREKRDREYRWTETVHQVETILDHYDNYLDGMDITTYSRMVTELVSLIVPGDT